MKASHSGLTISHLQVDDGILLAARGYLDLSTRLRLSTVLNEAVAENHEVVILDLCEVDYLDSTALGVLMNARRRLVRAGRRLGVVCPPGNVRRIFELSGLDSTISLHDSREEALSVRLDEAGGVERRSRRAEGAPVGELSVPHAPDPTG